jgi:hypothetical protein
MALLTNAATAQGQRTVTSDRPISPSVVASFLTRGDELVLLALWRGGPGWFWRATGAPGEAGGSGDQIFQQISEGGLTFRIDYDFRAGTATLLGRQISLKETNVVLVDGVDASAGPTVVAMERTDPRLEDPLRPEATVIRRHPNLYQFLKCDLPLPPAGNVAVPLQEATLAASCEEMKP